MPRSEHDYPSQAEPRAHGALNLNSASEDELASLPILGPERAKALCRSRPVKGWSDIEKVPGIGKGVVDDLRSGGAQLRKRHHRKHTNILETGSGNLGARAHQVGGCDPALFEAPAKSQVGPILVKPKDNIG
jgi:hypothetical protein